MGKHPELFLHEDEKCLLKRFKDSFHSDKFIQTELVGTKVVDLGKKTRVLTELRTMATYYSTCLIGKHPELILHDDDISI